MKEFIKKNFAILLAFVLPLLLIVVVALNTYLPSLFISTDYNFLYTLCTDSRGYNYSSYYCQNYIDKQYSVLDNELVVNSLDFSKDIDGNGVLDFKEKEKFSTRIFLHNTQKNESREITLKEAQALRLDDLLTSPDGVTVSSDYSYSGGGDLFFIFGGGGRSSYGYYLMKGKNKSKLNLINSSDQYYYQNNFQFLGWVLPGRD